MKLRTVFENSKRKQVVKKSGKQKKPALSNPFSKFDNILPKEERKEEAKRQNIQ